METEAAADTFDLLLGYHLRRLSVAVMADLTASLAPLGLKPAEATILLTLASHAGLTQSDLGRMLGIQRANMAPLMAGLMKRGLVEREAVDGRSQALRLSVEGEARQREAWRVMQAHEARVFGALSPAARARMVKQLKPVWQAMQNAD